MASTSGGARTPPRAMQPLAMSSTRPSTATRSRFGVRRWSRVKAATSRMALDSPTAPMATRATVGSTTSPTRAIGAPHAASAAMNAGTRRRPASIVASRAPMSPPRPIAAVSVPTPASPIPRSSMAATTMSTLRMPRTSVWKPIPTRIVRTPGRRAPARNPADSWSTASRAVTRSRPTAGTTRVAMAARPRAYMATTEIVATSGPATTSRRPTRAGPRKVPRPSAALEPTLAPTSCSGVRATAGRRAMWMGRCRALAAASTMTTTMRTHRGRARARTTTAPTMARVRTAISVRRTDSGRQRATGSPDSGATSIWGTNWASPRMADVRGPARVVGHDEGHDDERGLARDAGQPGDEQPAQAAVRDGQPDGGERGTEHGLHPAHLHEGYGAPGRASGRPGIATRSQRLCWPGACCEQG